MYDPPIYDKNDSLFSALNIFSYQIVLSQAGILDLSFGVNGIVRTDIANANDYGFSTVVQPDGKIIVAGFGFIDTIEYNNFVVIRYHVDGSLDTSFDNYGIVLVNGRQIILSSLILILL